MCDLLYMTSLNNAVMYTIVTYLRIVCVYTEV